MRRHLLRLTLLLVAGCGTSADPNLPDGATPSDAGLDTSAMQDSYVPPKCGTDAWLTYGHDGRRTFATDACITGPLSVSWTYTPAPPMTKTVKAMHHALAASDAVYLQWAASAGQYVGTTAADRVSPQGMRVWTYDTGTDANMGNWASVSGANLVLQDDGLYLVDLATGKGGPNTGVDWWGQTIPAQGGSVWFVTTSKSDGPGLFVGLIDAMAKVVWKANEQGTKCGDALSDVMGGIAVDGNVLFYAPSYKTGSMVQPTFASGVWAFDAATGGAPKWQVPSTPTSAVSAGNGNVYVVESSELVARKQADGSKAWSQAVMSPGAQAPVLANGLVIVGTATGVSAFDAKTGAPSWQAPMAGAAARAYTIDITNGCSGLQHLGAPIATTLAAALPSNTLVVTAADGVHVLSLSNGMEQWKGAVPGAKNPVHDPVLVGNTVYVIDSAPSSVGGFGAGQLIALKGS